MSGSGSESSSFSSSEAIIAHFDEAAGTLVEGGFEVPRDHWDSVVEAIRDENIDEISFWGIGTSGDATALLSLRIDWRKHSVAVAKGDAVDLPMDGGSIRLLQVRRAAMSFLRAFNEQGLSPVMHLRYTPQANRRRAELNAKYGWHDVEPIRQKGGQSWGIDSRYHNAVRLVTWFGD